MEQQIHTQTVNVYPFRTDGLDFEFLVLKKSATSKSSQAGLWQVVAGKLEGRETSWQAALRELREETGCEPLRFFEAGVECFYNYRRDVVCMHPTFAAQLAPGAHVTLSEEHEGFEWLPFDEALLRLPYAAERESITRVRFNIADPQGPLPMEIPESVWKQQ